MAERRSASSRTGRLLLSVGLVVLIAAAILVVRLVETIGPDRFPADRFRVVKVIDGDTVELLGGDRLRLLGVDTPESGEPLHDEATAFLARHTLGKTISIEYAERRRDRYGRLLGFLYVDSFHINRALLDSGYACLYLFKDNELESPVIAQLLSAQQDAIKRQVGLWALPHEPENRYVATESSLRFHRPGCRSVSKLKPGHYREFATREEPLYLGLSPCRNCRP
jgi:endonuclease YncB( thermonuclease family)